MAVAPACVGFEAIAVNALKSERGGAEPEPERPPEVLEAPPYLESYAADEWHRLAGELYRLKLLTVVDVHLFALYCESYRVWRSAGEMLSAMAACDLLTAGVMVKTQNGSATQ